MNKFESFQTEENIKAKRFDRLERLIVPEDVDDSIPM